jgi:radical SAM protein with 4Fe4S-binding SPASM domain
MDEIPFKKLIIDLKYLGVKSIEFSGGGEPTTHPKCFELAEYILKLGLRVGMFTNGMFFDWNRIKYFDYIRVGLDSMDDEGFAKMKGVYAFDRITNHIRRLVEMKGNTKIGIKFIINEDNFDSILDFVEFGKSLGVDYVNFRKLFTVKDEQKELDAYYGLYNAKVVYGDFIYGDFSFEDLKEQCFMAPIHVVIMANGNVLNCCYFNDESHVIGNFYTHEFHNIWYSDRHLDVLNSISPSECNKQTCRWRGYNNKMKELLDGKEFISFI